MKRLLASLAVVALFAAAFVGYGHGRASSSPGWAIVFQHVDRALGDVTGLDVLTSRDRQSHALTRRPPGTHDFDADPVWSPDGQAVAFARAYSHTGLYVVDATGGARRLLARGNPYALAWSPDGSRIAFSRSCGPGSAPCRPGIYVAYLDRSRLKRIFPLTGSRSSDDNAVPAVAWSPDGRRLLCLCAKAIYVFGADGSKPQRLIAPSKTELGPAMWSTNGRLIAFERDCAGMRGPHDVVCDVGFMDAAGRIQTTGSRHQPVGTSISDAPSWQPDGDVLVVDWVRQRVVSIDPRTDALRVVYGNVGRHLTAAPGNEFALLTESSSQRFTLVISNRAGHPLVRRPLPIEFGTDASLHIG